MIDDLRTQDIHGLFDWRSAAARNGQTDDAASPVANDDLALALQLLSCNARDREQFGTPGMPDVRKR